VFLLNSLFLCATSRFSLTLFHSLSLSFSFYLLSIGSLFLSFIARVSFFIFYRSGLFLSFVARVSFTHLLDGVLISS